MFQLSALCICQVGAGVLRGIEGWAERAGRSPKTCDACEKRCSFSRACSLKNGAKTFAFPALNSLKRFATMGESPIIFPTFMRKTREVFY